MPIAYRRRLIFASLCLALSASCGKGSADDHLKKANALFDQGKFADAIIEYRTAEQIDDKRGDVRLKLGDAYMKVNDLKNAIREYVRAADLLPNDADAQIKAGTLLLVARAYEDAKTRANRAIAIDPKRADAQILLGNSLAGLKDMDGAVADYQEAIALNPSGDTAYMNIGAVELSRGNRDMAEASFKKAVDVAPKSVQARLALANFQWATGRTADAEQTLKDALALDPANLTANRALGMFYFASNRAKEAEPFFQTIASTAKTTAATISLADYYVIVRRFDDARNILKELAKQDDTYAVAATRLAAIDVAEGLRAEASVKLREVLEKKPKESPARLLYARVLLRDGRKTQALTEAETVVNQDPNARIAADAYMVIGSIKASLDRRDEAIAAYQEVVKRQAQPLGAQLALAALELAGGHFDKANTYIQQALAIQTNNPEALVLRIRVLLAQKNLSKAAEEIAALKKTYPNSPTVLNLIGTQEFVAGHVDAAGVAYAKAAQLAPNSLEAVAGLVRVDLAKGRKTEALARLEAGLKGDQPSGEFLTLAATTYAQAGDLDKTEELLKRAITAEPGRLEAYGMLGALYVRQQRLDDARNQFQKMVDQDPKSISANTMLGMIYEAQRLLHEAEAQYQKVMAIDRTAAVAANNLAWLYVASDRNLDEALELAQAAHQAYPDEPHISDTLGWIYYKKRLFTQSIRLLESSVDKTPADATTRYHLGMAYTDAGDTEKARAALKKALALKGDFDGAAEARKMLAQIGG